MCVELSVRQHAAEGEVEVLPAGSAERPAERLAVGVTLVKDLCRADDQDDAARGVPAPAAGATSNAGRQDGGHGQTLHRPTLPAPDSLVEARVVLG